MMTKFSVADAWRTKRDLGVLNITHVAGVLNVPVDETLLDGAETLYEVCDIRGYACGCSDRAQNHILYEKSNAKFREVFDQEFAKVKSYEDVIVLFQYMGVLDTEEERFGVINRAFDLAQTPSDGFAIHREIENPLGIDNQYSNLSMYRLHILIRNAVKQAKTLQRAAELHVKYRMMPIACDCSEELVPWCEVFSLKYEDIIPLNHAYLKGSAKEIFNKRLDKLSTEAIDSLKSFADAHSLYLQNIVSPRPDMNKKLIMKMAELAITPEDAWNVNSLTFRSHDDDLKDFVSTKVINILKQYIANANTFEEFSEVLGKIPSDEAYRRMRDDLFFMCLEKATSHEQLVELYKTSRNDSRVFPAIASIR